MPSLTTYLKTHFPGDLVGGLTTAIVALPIALAFGVASGLGAEAGLYGAIATGIVAALFGGTPGQASGPTGPMTVVAASLVAQHAGHPTFIFAAILLAGVLQIVFGLTRTGQYVHYIPYPVVSGFMTGIGVIIILLQLPPLLGLASPASPLETLTTLPHLLGRVNTTALGLGLAVMALIYLLPRLHRQLPASLIALALASLAVALWGLGVPLLGTIPSGLPQWHFPGIPLSDVQMLLPAAFALAMLGSIDSLLTSLVVDRFSGQHHNSNQELIGQGLGNIASACIGGLPGTGATMRSMVNLRSGGRTRLSGAFHGLFLLAVLLELGPLVGKIPFAALAGVLITVGLSIIDYRGLGSIGKASKSDVAVMLTVLGLTVFVDLIVAVLVGLALAGTLFSKKLGDRAQAPHGRLESLAHLDALMEKFPPALRRDIYCYTLNAPLYFASVRQFREVVEQLPEVKALILHFQYVSLIDQTGAYALEDAIAQLSAKGVRVVFVGLREGVLRELSALGVLSAEHTAFESLEAALEALASEPIYYTDR